MGQPTDSKRSRSATANCGPYRSINGVTGYCPARSHLLHAIANASVRAMTSASVEGEALQSLHLGGSAGMPLSTLIGRPRFRRKRPAATPRRARRPDGSAPPPIWLGCQPAISRVDAFCPADAGCDHRLTATLCRTHLDCRAAAAKGCMAYVLAGRLRQAREIID